VTMTRALFLCMMALTFAGIFALLQAGLFIYRLEPKAAAALDGISAIEKSTSDLEQATYATEGEISNLADTMNAIATGLSVHEAEELQATRNLSTKLDTLIDHADADVQTLGDTERATKAAVEGLAADSHVTLGAAHDALAAAALQIGDPDIHESLASIRASAASIAKASADGAATAADVHKVADHYTQQILKPVSKAKRALLLVSSAVGSFLHSVLF
jgi:hypothetical protein